jgi:hypothetical protein
MIDDDKVIAPSKLELTAEEAQAADLQTRDADDPVPVSSTTGEDALEGPAAAAVSAKWPAKDADAPDYRHLSPSQIETPPSFQIVPDDIELVLLANRFDPHGKFKGDDATANEVIAVAFRGLTLGPSNEHPKLEVENAQTIEVMDTRPDHENYKCAIGFYVRTADKTARKMTLFAGSTVPNPFLMNAYRQKVLAHTPEPFEKCNMLPSGCYVCRVDHHKNIRPALRMADSGDLSKDATCTVIRTSNDLTYSTDDFWDLCIPTDNVHCAFATSRVNKWHAAFSSEGCVTVRGSPAPTDQWAKYQAVLTRIGAMRRCDLLLVTGRDLAIAAKLRASGQAGDAAVVRRELVRLRTGSNSDEVKRLRAKLSLPDGSYFGPTVRKKLADEQARRGTPVDAIFSPALDAEWGWQVFQ